jgi:hypothetical protein
MSNTSDLNEYIGVGYFITRVIQRPQGMSANLLPERIVTVSRCLVEMLPGAWALRWTGYSDRDRMECAAKFGMSAWDAQRFIGWATDKFDSEEIGWPGVFVSPKLGAEAVRTFVGSRDDVIIVGMGLHNSLVKSLVSFAVPSSQEGATGIYSGALKSEPLEAGGKALGFEVLGYDHGDFHSWLCNYLPDPTDSELGIKPGAFGLIEQFEDAKTVADYAGRDDVGAEPGIWLPWLLVSYPIVQT